MKWYGKEIYCTRGETFALDCSITNQDGTPFRISNDLTNVFLVLTVTSANYDKTNRYTLYNWINMSEFPKVNDVTILEIDNLPSSLNNDYRYRILFVKSDGKYYVYDESANKFVEYGFRLTHTFESDVTKNWIDKTYEYDLKLVAGELKESYINAYDNAEEYFDIPFNKINFSIPLIEKSKIYVNDYNGGDIYE